MPTGSNLGMLLFGLLLLAVGIGLTFKAAFAQWALRMGTARLWNALLGEERALKLTRYFFGPLNIVTGLICILGSFVLQRAGR